MIEYLNRDWTGEDIRAARRRRGWTGTALADRLGITLNHLYRIERGERRLAPWLARLAARILTEVGENHEQTE